MNTVIRSWLTWQHRRKFRRIGAGCVFPVPRLSVSGHVEVGEQCRFRDNVTLRTSGEGCIRMGNRSGLSWGCLLEAHELIEIGSRTAVAEYTHICDHGFLLRGTEGNWREAPDFTAPVRIGDDAFVGSGCFIGPGVTIGDGAAVGNFSVVTQDVGPYEVWVGAPARRVANRLDGLPWSEPRSLAERYGTGKGSDEGLMP